MYINIITLSVYFYILTYKFAKWNYFLRDYIYYNDDIPINYSYIFCMWKVSFIKFIEENT